MISIMSAGSFSGSDGSGGSDPVFREIAAAPVVRSRRASLPFSIGASSRTSRSSEGSRSMQVTYKCKQTTTGIFAKKTKELYEGSFQRYNLNG